MKRLLLLIIATIVCSCTSNKVFYEYEDEETRTYAVLEMSKKRPLVSYKYARDNDFNKLLYIRGTKSLLTSDDIGIPVLFDLLIIDSTLNIISCGDLDGGSVFIYDKDEKQEGKVLLIKEKRDKIKCLETHDITWFPPYMKKVDKINYNKFPEEIRETVIAIDKNKSQEKIQEILQKQKVVNEYKN